MTISPSEIIDDKSAKWFPSYIGSLPVGIFRITIKGEIVFCNRTCARILGYNSDNGLIGCSAFSLCRDKKSRDEFLKTILEKGFVDDFTMGLNANDGTFILCSVTARGVFDNKGRIVFFDGVLKDIAKAMEGEGTDAYLDKMADTLDDFVFLINTEGVLIDINNAGTNFFGLPKEKLLKQPLSKFISPEYKDLFSFFLTDILETRQLDGVLTMMGKVGTEYHVDFYAILVKRKTVPPYIRIIGRDITGQIKLQRERLKQAKLQGALEMAGGTAHRLNQPLTIVSNLLKEILTNLHVNADVYQKLTKVNAQMENLTGIARKIKSIKRYETMDYVGGIKIIDIDKASETDGYQNGPRQVAGEGV